MTDYKTVLEKASAEYVEKRSRFIASVCPVQTEAEALAFLETVRSAHREASHHVYAYACRENHIARFSDDGEPAGTAGMPVMHVLQSKGLVDVCVVVTRYFGGTKLGAGGLVRAYSKSAADGIEKAGECMQIRSSVFAVHMDYSLLGRMQYVIAEENFITLDIQYGEEVVLTLCTACARGAFLKEKLFDAAGGRITFEQLDDIYYAKKTEAV